jgi:GAF domain-containing protein
MTSLSGPPGKFSDHPGLDGLLQLVAIQANAEVVDAGLNLVVALAHAAVAGADGASVTLSRHGTLATVAASDETISGMDADQYATGQGPCISAATDGHRIYVDSLDAESRWPQFIPRAKQRGINSILSMPLLTRGRPLGALNIYSTVAGAFAEPEQRLATLCAQQASDFLASATVDVSPVEVSDRIREALQVRQAVTLAVGVVMDREGVSVDDAYAMLLQSAHQSAIPLREQAGIVVASTERAAPLGPAKGEAPTWTAS